MGQGGEIGDGSPFLGSPACRHPSAAGGPRGRADLPCDLGAFFVEDVTGQHPGAFRAETLGDGRSLASGPARDERHHAGHPENERCDELAVAAGKQKTLLIDSVFEMGNLL